MVIAFLWQKYFSLAFLLNKRRYLLITQVILFILPVFLYEQAESMASIFKQQELLSTVYVHWLSSPPPSCQRLSQKTPFFSNWMLAYYLYLKKKIDYCQNSLKFTANLIRRHRDIPNALNLPLYQNLSKVSNSHPNGMLFTIDDSALTHCYHPEALVSLRVHSSCCTCCVWKQTS